MRPTPLGGVQLSVGEINLYKVSAVATVGIIACKGLAHEKFGPCVTSTLTKVAQAVTDLKPADDGKTSS
jgi:hypothetical protein